MKRFQKYFGNFKKKKTSDIKVVVLCVIAATTFWVLNALNKDNYVTVVNYPIAFQYNAQEYMAIEELPSEVRIEINGNGWDLFRKYFNVNVSPFIIELSNPDEQNFLPSTAFRRSLNEVLSPTDLVSILTDTLKFEINKIITAQVDLELDTTSFEVAAHHKLVGPISLSPQTVEVKGPSSKIKQLGSSLFISLEGTKIDEDYNQFVPIVLPEVQKKYLSISPQTVNINFEVIAFLEGNKRLKLQKKHFPKDVHLDNEINSVLLKYRVDERRVEDLKELELEGILDYRNRNKKDSTVSIEINNLPEYIESISMEPKVFRLVYE